MIYSRRVIQIWNKNVLWQSSNISNYRWYIQPWKVEVFRKLWQRRKMPICSPSQVKVIIHWYGMATESLPKTSKAQEYQRCLEISILLSLRESVLWGWGSWGSCAGFTFSPLVFINKPVSVGKMLVYNRYYAYCNHNHILISHFMQLKWYVGKTCSCLHILSFTAERFQATSFGKVITISVFV